MWQRWRKRERARSDRPVELWEQPRDGKSVDPEYEEQDGGELAGIAGIHQENIKMSSKAFHECVSSYFRILEEYVPVIANKILRSDI
jgi:hypothetical protein